MTPREVESKLYEIETVKKLSIPLTKNEPIDSLDLSKSFASDNSMEAQLKNFKLLNPETNDHQHKCQNDKTKKELEIENLDVYKVTIKCGPYGYGLCITNGKGALLDRIFIVSLKNKSPAERCGTIDIGDELIKVNEQPVFGKTHQEVSDMMLKFKGSHLVLTLVRHKPDNISPTDKNKEGTSSLIRFFPRSISLKQSITTPNICNIT
ncbi:hypothetical protein HZS_7658 [Henneguya salminicola]|nr:hypothetical protein HZS_7658 [Henneguya salminicola]